MVKQTDKAQTTTAKVVENAKGAGATLDRTTEAYLKAFGKEAYLAACALAATVITQARESDVIIIRQQGGNAERILKLSRECVKLTMKGARANLEKAAELFLAACQNAEQDLIATTAHQNGGQELALAEIVPSWPPMRSTVYNGMRKAHINPEKVDTYKAIERGYKEWKDKPENADAKSARGRKKAATDTAGSDTPRGEADKELGLISKDLRGKLSHEFQSALAELCQAAAGANADQQAEAAGLIKAIAAKLIADGQAWQATLKEKIAAAPQDRRRPAPARERGGAGATAE